VHTAKRALKALFAVCTHPFFSLTADFPGIQDHLRVEGFLDPLHQFDLRISGYVRCHDTRIINRLRGTAITDERNRTHHIYKLFVLMARFINTARAKECMVCEPAGA